MKRKIVYKIWYKCPNQPWEVIDSFDNKKEADEMLKEYAMAYRGQCCSLKVKRGYDYV